MIPNIPTNSYDHSVWFWGHLAFQVWVKYLNVFLLTSPCVSVCGRLPSCRKNRDHKKPCVAATWWGSCCCLTVSVYNPGEKSSFLVELEFGSFIWLRGGSSGEERSGVTCRSRAPQTQKGKHISVRGCWCKR